MISHNVAEFIKAREGNYHQFSGIYDDCLVLLDCTSGQARGCQKISDMFEKTGPKSKTPFPTMRARIGGSEYW